MTGWVAAGILLAVVSNCEGACKFPDQDALYIPISDTKLRMVCKPDHILTTGGRSTYLECDEEVYRAKSSDGAWEEGEVVCVKREGQDYCEGRYYPQYAMELNAVTSCPAQYQLARADETSVCVDGLLHPEDWCSHQCPTRNDTRLYCPQPGSLVCPDGALKENEEECATDYSKCFENSFGLELRGGMEAALEPSVGQQLLAFDGSLTYLCDSAETWTYTGESSPVPDDCSEKCSNQAGSCHIDCIRKQTVRACLYSECDAECGDDGECICGPGYYGPICQYKSCPPLQDVANASVTRGDGTTTIVTCHPKHYLPRLATEVAPSLRLYCHDGTWLPSVDEGCTPVTQQYCAPLKGPPDVLLLNVSDTGDRVVAHCPDQAQATVSCVDNKWVQDGSRLLVERLTQEEWRLFCDDTEACMQEPKPSFCYRNSQRRPLVDCNRDKPANNSFVFPLSDTVERVYCRPGYTLTTLAGPALYVDSVCDASDDGAEREDILLTATGLPFTGGMWCTPVEEGVDYCQGEHYPQYDMKEGKVTKCPPSYSLVLPTDVVECVAGVLHPEDWCSHECSRPAPTEGYCPDPGTVVCSDGAVRDNCSMVSHPCDQQFDYLVKKGFGRSTLETEVGKVFPDLRDTLQHRCDTSGSWSYSGDPEAFISSCEEGCSSSEEEGKCTRGCLMANTVPACDWSACSKECDVDGRCLCPEGYYGAVCQYRSCGALPDIPWADFMSSESKAIISCGLGFNFTAVPSVNTLIAYCLNGNWVLPSAILDGCESSEEETVLEILEDFDEEVGAANETVITVVDYLDDEYEDVGVNSTETNKPLSLYGNGTEPISETDQLLPIYANGTEFNSGTDEVLPLSADGTETDSETDEPHSLYSNGTEINSDIDKLLPSSVSGILPTSEAGELPNVPVKSIENNSDTGEPILVLTNDIGNTSDTEEALPTLTDGAANTVADLDCPDLMLPADFAVVNSTPGRLTVRCRGDGEEDTSFWPAVAAWCDSGRWRQEGTEADLGGLDDAEWGWLCFDMEACERSDEPSPREGMTFSILPATNATRYALGVLTCSPGYDLTPKNNANGFYMKCSLATDYQWRLVNEDSLEEVEGEMPLIACTPVCDPPCVEPGYCSAPGECQCPADLSGPRCDVSSFSCGDLPLIPRGAVVSMYGDVAVQCDPGTVTTSSRAKFSMTCRDGQWVVVDDLGDPTGEEAACSPRVLQCPPPIVAFGIFHPNSTLPEGTVRCHPGYRTPAGSSEFGVVCDEDRRWSPVGGAVMMPQCAPVCLSPCLNGGTCASPGRCRCAPGFEGRICDVRAGCPTPPITPQFGELSFNDTNGIVHCYSGYQTPTEGTSFNIRCEDGRWQTVGEGGGVQPQPGSCAPACLPACENGGACVAPGRCHCPPSFSGPRCSAPCDQPRSRAGCTSPPPMPVFADVYYNGSVGVVECHPGYEIHTGLTHFHVQCANEKWISSNKHGGQQVEVLPVCTPVCHYRCLNGGVCSGPNTCDCPDQFRGDQCQIPQLPNCPNEPAPVPNANINVTENGRFLSCGEGYRLVGGLQVAEVWCSGGSWVYPRELYGQLGGGKEAATEEETFAPCLPVCEPTCVNGGVCVGPGVCQCVEPFGGKDCSNRDSAQCWTRPPLMANASIMFSSSSASIACEEGFSLGGGQARVQLTCRGGAWGVAGGDAAGGSELAALRDGCAPVCAEACQNGGVCTDTNRCSCPPGFLPPTCRDAIPRPCLTRPLARHNAFITISDEMGVLQCMAGYSVMGGHATVAQMSCTNGEWRTVAGGADRLVAEVQCEPVCRGGCRNAGVCIAPGQCRCADGWGGPRCDDRECELAKLGGDNDTRSTVEYNAALQIATVRCRPGFRLTDGGLSVELTCRAGRWYDGAAAVQSGAEAGGALVTCHPTCIPPCLNGGRCVAPSTCKCPPGFIGETCNKRYSLSPTKTRCVFPFLHRGRMRHTCVTRYNFSYWQTPDLSELETFYLDSNQTTTPAPTTDKWFLPSNAPWCPTTVDSFQRPVLWEPCVGTVDNTTVAVTVDGEQCVLPFTHLGSAYQACTTEGRDVLWCATQTGEGGMAVRWGECAADHGVEPVTLTYQAKRCRFPFRYEGRWHSDCLSTPSSGGSWCATDVNRTGHLLTKGDCIVDWGYSQERLTTSRRLCSDTTEDTCREGWCVVGRGEAGERWSYCDPKWAWPGVSVSLPGVLTEAEVQVYSVQGDLCEKGGPAFGGCTVDASLPGVAWCPLAPRDPQGVSIKRGVCAPDWHLTFVFPWQRSYVDAGAKDPLSRMTLMGNPCILPFKYRGRTYLDCAPLETGYPDEAWCATAVSKDLQLETWEACKKSPPGFVYAGPKLLSVTQRVITNAGKPCVLPFRHQQKVYFSCLQELHGDEGWCAVSVSASGEMTERGMCPPIAKTFNKDDMVDKCKDDNDDLTMKKAPKAGRPGKGKGQQCIAPFRHNNVTHWGCTATTPRWCATKVGAGGEALERRLCGDGWYLKATADLEHVAWDQNWLIDMMGGLLRRGGDDGFSQDRPVVTTTSGLRCIFPATVGGVTRWRCGCMGRCSRSDPPHCAVEVDGRGGAVRTEPCRAVRVRKINWFDRLTSH